VRNVMLFLYRAMFGGMQKAGLFAIGAVAVITLSVMQSWIFVGVHVKL
jgi:hypothetical protein